MLRPKSILPDLPDCSCSEMYTNGGDGVEMITYLTISRARLYKHIICNDAIKSDFHLSPDPPFISQKQALRQHNANTYTCLTTHSYLLFWVSAKSSLR